MVLERAEINAKEGMIHEFIAAIGGKGADIIRGVPGCLSVQVGRGIESPDKLLLLVDWESLEAHEVFKKMPEYAELGKLIGPYAAGGGAEHFKMV